MAGVGLRDVLLEELDERPERQPERAVGREGDGAERVAGAELPHPGEQLREPAIGEREPEDDGLTARADEARVEHAQHERREREGGEAERARIGDDGGCGRACLPRAGAVADGGVAGDGPGFHETPSYRSEASVP